jgi:N-acetylmuramoyl-L-alanine amidase
VRRPSHLLFAVLVLAAGLTALLQGQGAPGRGAVLTLLSPGERRPVPITVSGGHEMVSLDDLAPTFDLTVREDAAAGGLTIAHGNRTLVVSLTQGLASASGRLVSLPAPAVKAGSSWLVPVEVVGRGLPLIVTEKAIDWRRASRLVVIGNLRVPRVAVRTETGEGRASVVLDVTPSTPHAVSRSGQSLLVSFTADALDALIPAAGAGGNEVLRGVRLADPGTVVALELGPAFSGHRVTEAPAEGGGTRISVDLLAAGTTTSIAPAAPEVAPRSPVEPAAPLFEQPTSAIRTVVIDPGHGGEERGARGPAGTLEKDVTLAVARQLKALLEARLGVRVLLTRDGDRTVALDERAALANNNKADLFVSLHANASVRSSVSGAEVFYLSLDEYAKGDRLADDETGELLPVAGGGEREVALILWEKAQARHIEDSATLATLVEQELRARVPMSARAIQQAPFRVLVGANMPAVLVEMGFITNAAEEKKLAAPEHQREIVLALYESIVRFRLFLEGGRRGIAPQVARGTSSPALAASAPAPAPATGAPR